MEESLIRAQEAITRARDLSHQLSLLTLRASTLTQEAEASGPARECGVPTALQRSVVSSGQDEPSTAIAASSTSAGSPHHDHEATSSLQRASSSSSELELSTEEEDSHATALLGAQPVLLVAQKLALLQQRQNNTLRQLMLLRLEQMKLREQQLVALQELLRAEADIIEGTPLQVSAVDQAVTLLSQSVIDMRAATRVVLYSTPNDAKAVAAAVHATDVRADEVSRMARQLLSVLREFPRKSIDNNGASDEAILGIPTITCTASSPLFGQTCAICLGCYEEGDSLKSIQCLHYYHTACMDQWLRIKACCPLCKVNLP